LHGIHLRNPCYYFYRCIQPAIVPIRVIPKATLYLSRTDEFFTEFRYANFLRIGVNTLSFSD